MDTGLRRHDDIGKLVFLAYTQFPAFSLQGILGLSIIELKRSRFDVFFTIKAGYYDASIRLSAKMISVTNLEVNP